MRSRLFILFSIMLATISMMAQGFDFAALDSSYVTCTTGSYYHPYSSKGVVMDVIQSLQSRDLIA